MSNKSFGDSWSRIFHRPDVAPGARLMVKKKKKKTSEKNSNRNDKFDMM